MILTEDNYYTPDADREYMSCSQFQLFCECEAKAMAKLQKRWVDKPSEAFLVGNYFHSYFESPEAHQKFCTENADKIYTQSSYKKYITLCQSRDIEIEANGKSGIIPEAALKPLAKYEQADNMIRVVKDDPLMKQFLDLDGENEKIVTGEIFGVKWRGKLDKYIPEMRFIVDYKTVANIWETTYNPVTKERETFVQKYGYLFRAAVYSLLEMQMHSNIGFRDAYDLMRDSPDDAPNFFLLCVSKQDYPDKEVIRLNHAKEYIRELDAVKEKLGRIQAIKSGIIEPRRCGMCDYCRSTKILKEIKPYYELIPAFRTAKETEYIQEGEDNESGA